VFILLDQPNEQLDGLLSEHVMALHSGVKRRGEIQKQSVVVPCCSGEQIERPLYEWLKLRPGETMDFLPHQLFRKYLMYARKYVRSRLTPSSASVLQKFYLDLRRQHQLHDCTPITTRQLESLIRLTEARAKLELREEATEKDAQDVVDIMKYSMVDTLSDGYGNVDFQRSQNGSGTSSKNQGKIFITALQRRADAQSRSVFTIQELKEVAQLTRIKVSDFHSFLLTLNVQGFLLKKAPKLYQLLTVDY
jgi:DNA helicase MCM8